MTRSGWSTFTVSVLPAFTRRLIIGLPPLVGLTSIQTSARAVSTSTLAPAAVWPAWAAAGAGATGAGAATVAGFAGAAGAVLGGAPVAVVPGTFTTGPGAPACALAGPGTEISGTAGFCRVS